MLTVWDLPERARFIGVLLDAEAEAGASPPADVPLGPPFFHFSDQQEMVRLLGDPGLEDIEVDGLSFVHSVSSPEHLWRGLLGGTVRTSALVLGQPDAVQSRIRYAFDRLVQEYGVDAGLEVPVSAKVTSAREAGAAH